MGNTHAHYGLLNYKNDHWPTPIGMHLEQSYTQVKYSIPLHSIQSQIWQLKNSAIMWGTQ